MKTLTPLILLILLNIACSGPKQIGDSDNYAFKNQSLTLISRIDFCHVNTFIDSTALRYKNKKHEEFQIRVPKLAAYKMYEELKQLGKISFTAKKHWDSGYIINEESIKEETK